MKMYIICLFIILFVFFKLTSSSYWNLIPWSFFELKTSQ
jgi:hypothetical protein